VVLHQVLRNTARGASTSRNGIQAKVLEVSKDCKAGEGRHLSAARYGCWAPWDVWSCVVLHQVIKNTAGGALTSGNGFPAKVLEVSKDYRKGKAVT
jgi:hypothetical protein